MPEQVIEVNPEQLLQFGLQARLAFLKQRLVDQVGYQVQAGPFRGMGLPHGSTWGANGDFIPKLIGCYEQELHGALRTAISRKPKKVFNIGCAEGYYAIGLALRLPGAKVWAVDKDQKALDICLTSATGNDVFERMATTDFDGCLWNETVRSDDHCLAVIDVEGDEMIVLDELRASAMKNTDIIVECHDFIKPGITEKLVDRFSKSHTIEIINEQDRHPLQMPHIANWGQFDRVLATSEFRPAPMNWIAAWPKTI